MPVRSFYRYHCVIQQKCRLLCVESSNMRVANLFRTAANLPLMLPLWLMLWANSLRLDFQMFISIAVNYSPQINFILQISAYWNVSPSSASKWAENSKQFYNCFWMPIFVRDFRKQSFLLVNMCCFFFFSLLSLRCLWSLSWWLRESG